MVLTLKFQWEYLSFPVVGEPRFVMTVEKVRNQAGFSFCCVLVGIRGLGFKR